MHKILRAKSVTSFLLVIALLIPIAGFAQPLYYSVQNSTSGSLGTVTVSSSSNSTGISVLTTGTFVTEVPGTVTSVTVNGQTATYPTTTDIILPNSHPGRITFTSTTSVVIIDLMDGA